MHALGALIERNEKKAEAELRNDGEPQAEDTTAAWDHVDSWIDVAVASYAIADAMLIARRLSKE